MDDKLALQPNNTPGSNQILVPKEKLAQIISQNKELKDDRAALLSMLNSSVEMINFMKQTVFGGTMPTEITVVSMVKLATKIPRILKSMDESNIALLKSNFENIASCASQFLDEDQIKKISK